MVQKDWVMNFKQTPHPTIEDHFHIQDLINAQEKRSNDRTYHRERVKALEEREGLIKDSEIMKVVDFWCDKCRKDFKGQAVRQIEIDWTNPQQKIAFYKTKCFKGHWCQRLITDRHKDSFWSKSKLMALDRGNHYGDTLQPWETGFNTLYGKK